MIDIQIFWGCFIPNKFPHIEKSIRGVLKGLGIDFTENSRFTCCPEPQLKNLDEQAWLLTAGRNLAVAEEMSRDVVTPCNGCYETLKSVKIMMREHDELNKKINAELATFTPPLAYNGTVDVFHIAEYFWKMKEAIKDAVDTPLEGLKVAVHYGCHLIRPSREVQLDNPFEPQILDELVKILGADSILYNDKLLCCGGSYERAGKKEASLSTIQRKLKDMKDAGAEAVLVSCPNCYSQFEYEQMALEKQDYHFGLPVFFITDLIGLAIGLDDKDLGLGHHLVDVGPALERMRHIQVTRKNIDQEFNIDELQRCIDCSACVDDCPPTKMELLDPPALFRKLVEGHLDEVLDDETIWNCLDCYTCLEMCPDGRGFVKQLKKLRNMAAAAGKTTPGFQRQTNTFKTTLKVIPEAKSKRKQLDLPEIDRVEDNELKEKIKQE